MRERYLRAAIGIAYAVTFITVGADLFSAPYNGVILYMGRWGFTPLFMAWAFLVSGVANLYDGLRNRILNPFWFAVFVLYTGFTWTAFVDNRPEYLASAMFYTLLCAVYALCQYADRSEDLTDGGYS